MVYVVQALLGFRNAARRNTISSNIQTRLAQTVPFGTVTREDFTQEPGAIPSVTLEVAFQTKPEADSFWTDALAFVGTGINGPVAGSEMWRHDCPRNEEQTAGCVEADRRNW